MVTILDHCYYCYTRQTDLSRCDDHFISLSSLQGEKDLQSMGILAANIMVGGKCMKRKNTYNMIKILKKILLKIQCVTC